MTNLNATLDPTRRSWVASANAAGGDFPIQNLPFGRFRRAGSAEDWRIGVAIGDQILDLVAAGLIDTNDMNALMAAAPADRLELRFAISQGLREGSEKQSAWANTLLPHAQAEYTVPCRIGDYTDFYTGIHHATAVGKLFRPDQPVDAELQMGADRLSRPRLLDRRQRPTLQASAGQTKAPDATQPSLSSSKRLDYELELGFFVGQGNALGEPVDIAAAEDHLFGVCLLNDWSARDVQAWEYQPLGPFLAKNFATTLSPWIVTMEALTPFRATFERPAGDPEPLPYLDSAANRERGALDIVIEAWLLTAKMRAAGEGPTRLTRSKTAQSAYWTAAQLLTHHTVNGCNLQPGDLLGSGTLSGPSADEAGSLLELTAGGRHALTLANAEKRTFLEDGDTLILRGYCEREGAVSIGFGEASGTVLAP